MGSGQCVCDHQGSLFFLDVKRKKGVMSGSQGSGIFEIFL